MLSRVGSKLSTGAAVLIGGILGRQLKKHHDAEQYASGSLDRDNLRDTVTTLHAESRHKKTIRKILQSLEGFASYNAERNPVAESYVEKAKLQCRDYLSHRGMERSVEAEVWDVWLAECLSGVEWMDDVHFWPYLSRQRSRRSLSSSTYSATLCCGVKALWHLSSDGDICQGNHHLSRELVGMLKGVIEDCACKEAAPMALKVVANIAVHRHNHSLIHDSGLVDVLQSCADHHHPFIFLPAWRGLHNLKTSDRTSKHTDVYVEGVYPFVCPEEDMTPVVDVVLVHGIEGGAPWTWRQRDPPTHRTFLPQNLRKDIRNLQNDVMDEFSSVCWPLDWLVPELVLPVRVIALDFQARWSGWGCDSPAECVGKSLAHHSREMSRALEAAGVGSRPIVWITHSMGGLLVKHMLWQDTRGPKHHAGTSQHSASGKSVGLLARQTRGAVFCSVPHHGSSLATTTTTWPLTTLLQPTQEVHDMRTGNPVLAEIHESFLSLAREHEVAVLSLIESEPTQHSLPWWKLHFVTPQHADPGIGELCEVATTHRDICKPIDKNSDVYVKILHFLRDVVNRV